MGMRPQLRAHPHVLVGKQKCQNVERLPGAEGGPQKQERPVLLLLHGES